MLSISPTAAVKDLRIFERIAIVSKPCELIVWWGTCVCRIGQRMYTWPGAVVASRSRLIVFNYARRRRMISQSGWNAGRWRATVSMWVALWWAQSWIQCIHNRTNRGRTSSMSLMNLGWETSGRGYIISSFNLFYSLKKKEEDRKNISLTIFHMWKKSTAQKKISWLPHQPLLP